MRGADLIIHEDAPDAEPGHPNLDLLHKVIVLHSEPLELGLVRALAHIPHHVLRQLLRQLLERQVCDGGMVCLARSLCLWPYYVFLHTFFSWKT